MARYKNRKKRLSKRTRSYIVSAYKAGNSIRKITDLLNEMGKVISTDTVRRVLHEENVEMRPPTPCNGTRRSRTSRGYITIFVGRGKHHRATKAGVVLEHILVAEESLGRPLAEGEVVHHVNGVSDENAPRNLLVLRDIEEHRWVHRLLKRFERIARKTYEEATGASIDEASFSMVLRPILWPMIHEVVVLPLLPFYRRIRDGEDIEAVMSEFRSLHEDNESEVA